MKFVTALGATLLGLSTSVASGSPLRAEPLGFSPAPKLEKKQTCVNGPTTRNCWSSGFDSSTDMYTKWPNTGRIVNYDLSITNTTCNPDGQQARVCMLINNQYPGPTLIANWGDTFRITVRNKLQHNGTSIHWHGLRQLNSNSQDGVNGVTECALAPGDAKTYTFQATEYGTTWYHSHFSAQYGDGIVGTMIINGPATANYDLDLGTYALSDWYHITAFQAARRAFENGQRLAGPPTADNILVNGTNKGTTNTTGTYNNVKLQPGKTHRLRLVNTALDVALRVSLDGHPFTVIANDFVPVVPYTTNYLLIGIGQRYDVIIRANQTAGNYWFRADPEAACRTAAGGNGRSIFTYQGQTVANPTSNALPGRPSDCNDPLPTNKIVKNVPSAPFANQAQTLPVTFGNTTVASNNQSLILWTVNGTSLIVDPAEPTLEYVAKNNNSFPRDYNVVTVNSSSAWTYWVIQQAVGAPPIPHPIHLHGHDMYILGTGTGQFNVGQHLSSLRFNNPPRRDVFHLPASGWLVIAFPTDNPGAWLMHCHIAFHVAMGLGNQFLERKSEIKIPAPNSEWWNTCTNWDNYQRNKPVYLQDDSGLKKRWPPVIE